MAVAETLAANIRSCWLTVGFSPPSLCAVVRSLIEGDLGKKQPDVVFSITVVLKTVNGKCFPSALVKFKVCDDTRSPGLEL